MFAQTLPSQSKSIQPVAVKQRVQSIDLLRGLVIIIMAIDHTRHFAHIGELSGQHATDVATTSAGVFLTRWITHFCAPCFVFLSGTSAYFMRQKKTLRPLSFFLFTRGVWLIFLELTILALAWRALTAFHIVVLGVIWVLGLCMVLFAPLVYLSKNVLLFIGLLLVFGHNALDGYNKIPNNVAGFLWSLLHVPNRFTLGNGLIIQVTYCALPWLGLMILGYLIGDLYGKEVNPAHRKKRLAFLGLGCILLFVGLRSGNFYGDVQHWQLQADTTFTFLSFIDTTKYPPSLLFMLMTIGPALLFLAFSERQWGQLADRISVFGRVPLFFYILHLFLIHGIAWAVLKAQSHYMLFVTNTNNHNPGQVGLPLAGVYAIWLVVILILYWPCKWYNDYKSTHEDWWLSYL